MRQYSRANFQQAVIASAVLHLVVAVALVLVVCGNSQTPPNGSRLNTRADSSLEVSSEVRMYEVEGEAATPAPPTTLQVLEPQEPAASTSLPEFAPRLSSAVLPRTLPPELLARLRVACATIPEKSTAKASAAGGWPAGGAASALHGSLSPHQTIVYVLDGSGSMGAAGRFDRARAALAATLQLQPSTVRFQVIVFAGRAIPLLPSNGSTPLWATEANIRAAIEKLTPLEPRGKTSHLEAIRAALAFQPDVILLLTDVEDVTAATFQRLLATATKPTRIAISLVTAETIQLPRELK